MHAQRGQQRQPSKGVASNASDGVVVEKSVDVRECGEETKYCISD